MRVLSRRERVFRLLMLALLFGVALAIRSMRAVQEPVVTADAIRYVEMAQGLARDPIGTMRGEVYHPLHAAAGLAAHEVMGRFYADERMGWLASLVAVGVLCGAVVAVEIFWIARHFGAPFWASMGAAFLWVVGRRTSSYGADGLSDMLFLALFGGALLAGMRAMRFRHGEMTLGQGGLFFLSGILAGVAYLTRPEGLAAPLIVTLAIVVLMRPRREVSPWERSADRRFKLFPRKRVSVWAGLTGIGVMMIGAGLVAAPYMVVIGRITGKKSLSVMVEHGIALAGMGGVMGQLPEYGVVRALGMELWETFGFASCLALLLAIGLKQRLWGRPRLRLLVIEWGVVWVAVIVWLYSRAHYLDGRHTLPMQLMLHGLLALALVAWAKPMRWWMDWWRGRPAWAMLPAWRKWRGWPGVFACGVFVLIALPGVVMLRSGPGEDRSYVLEAAAWVKGHVKPGVVVADNEELVGYYAGTRYAIWKEPLENGGRGLDAIERQTGGPVMATYTFRPGWNEKPVAQIGKYRAVASFTSTKAEHGDVLVIFAAPGAAVFKGEAPAVLTTIGGR